MSEENGVDYRSSGVDLDAAERVKEQLGKLVTSTQDEHTLSPFGLFGGLYSVPETFEKPVLVASADGVGTKLQIAFMTNRHDSIGKDLVNHCVNDILVQGATPLFFLDYLASGGMDEEIVPEVISGIAEACRENRCTLLGGETAQMPGFYSLDEYDLAGFIVGIVEKDHIIDGSKIEAGDVLIGLESSGLHTNGYTLARKIVFETMGLTIEDEFPDDTRSVGGVLSEIHRSYLRELTPLLSGNLLHGLAHITGGGIEGNLPRIFKESIGAKIDLNSWETPNVFQVLQEGGCVAKNEMYRVFNMGIGMILVTSRDNADTVLGELEKTQIGNWVIGEVETGEGVRLV
ncbi:MAG: phosphoribosylformylglycinamidine cyclo-ligase [Longimicrobiales bacterium]|nr:phosphoribosylformylglycinamidine cyclo-ligase [Longimicrobiales bacterium]